MSKTFASSEELHKAFCEKFNSSKTVKNTAPISTIIAYRQIQTIDRDRIADHLIAQALDEDGNGIKGEILKFEINDPGDTGSTFIFTVDGKEYESRVAFSPTEDGGFAIPLDSLKAGREPGTFTIDVSVESSASDAKATYIRHISQQRPNEVKPISGGEETFAPGALVLVSLQVQLIDSENKPIQHGGIRFRIHDPFDTNTKIIFNGFEAHWREASVNQEGIASIDLAIAVGNVANSIFYILANRHGKPPFYPFKFEIIDAQQS